MRYQLGIGIFCVMLATIGIISAEVVDVGNTVDGITYQGYYTFDENGVLNGAVLAGASNGAVDVDQYANENNGNVVIAQCGDIQGDAGFALTGAQDGNGNSGGTFASFTGGEMYFGQATIAGTTSTSLPGSSGDLNSQIGDQVSVDLESLTLGGVVNGQFVSIEGSSGYTTTEARNVNGASALSTASFANGWMRGIQVSGSGGASLTIPNFDTDVGSTLDLPAPVDQGSLVIGGVFSGQGVAMEGSSGSASTSVRSRNGASGQSTASFTNGGMDAIQVGIAGDGSLTMPEYLVGTDSLLTDGSQGSVTVDGAIVGQGVAMGGASGSASTSVRSRNGASGQSTASFTNGGMDAIQAGIAGDCSLEYPIYSDSDNPLDLSLNGAIVGQGVDIGGDSGSASTSVTDGNGASGQTSASFTSGGEYIGGMSTIQLAGAGDVTLGLVYSPTSTVTGSSLSEEQQIDLTVGGIFAGQSGGMGGRTGSVSTSVTNVNGNSAGSSASFTDTSNMGDMDFTQVSAGAYLGSSSGSVLSGALSYQDIYSDDFSTLATNSNSRTAGNSLSQVNALAQGDSGTFDTTQFAGGIRAGNLDIALAGQDVGMSDVSEGYASGFSSDSHGNIASVRTSVHNGDLALDGGSSIPSGIITGAGDIGGLSGAVVLHDNVNIAGASGGLRSEASNSTGGSAYVNATFSDGGSLQSGSPVFLGMTGAALSIQSGDTNYIGAGEWNLAISGNTYLETELTGWSPKPTTSIAGTYDAYSYSVPALLPPPIPNPNSEIWRHP